MTTGRAPHDVTTGATGGQEAATPLRRTTLYDLTIAIQAVVGADDDALVVDHGGIPPAVRAAYLLGEDKRASAVGHDGPVSCARGTQIAEEKGT